MSLHKDVYEPFLSAGFKHKEVKIPPHEADPSLELQLHVLHYEPSAQPAEHTLVLLHGHPQSALIWHRVAPELVKKLRSTRIIIPDLRGHGKSQAAKVERTESGKYANEAARARYSKREMARDTIELSKQLGWQQGSDNKLWIAAHDRGARVTHRLALDYPQDVHKILLLDIAPTVDMYQTTDVRFAAAYWHWFFLIQPYPFPESMLTQSPRAYLEKMTTRSPNAGSSDIHPAAIMDAYEASLRSPDHAEATCEDYRQSSPHGIDFVHDSQSRSKGERINAPLRVLWGSRGVVEFIYGREKQMGFWRACCEHLDEQGSRAVEGGHYIPEELPDVVVSNILEFFELK